MGQLEDCAISRDVQSTMNYNQIIVFCSNKKCLVLNNWWETYVLDKSRPSVEKNQISNDTKNFVHFLWWHRQQEQNNKKYRIKWIIRLHPKNVEDKFANSQMCVVHVADYVEVILSSDCNGCFVTLSKHKQNAKVEKERGVVRINEFRYTPTLI